MQKVLLTINTKQNVQLGMSLVEVILAVAIFAVISTGVISAIIYGSESTAVAGARERATKIAEEGIEAVRNIRDSGFINLPSDGTYGLSIVGGIWTLSGSTDTTDIFTRSIILSTIDSRTRKVDVNVDWKQTVQRDGNISLNTYLTDWITPTLISRKGMLVYGDGGTLNDAIKYQIYDEITGSWTVAASTADIDSSSTNKYLRRAQLYSSATRNEKILVSKHYNGTRQWLYSQIYNGTTETWGNVNLLANWSSSNYLDTRNFDGTYLSNGDFVVLYSDNTTTPKFKKWNGTSWSTASGSVGTSTPGTGGIPNYIKLAQRPNTNEAMAILFDASSDTNSLYFWIGTNGTYETADWVLSTEHTNQATNNTRQMADFTWSSDDTTKGALIYTDSSSDKQMNIKIWTANGSGSGSWNSTAQYPTSQANNINALAITAIKGTPNFMACNKDAAATPLFICMRANNSGWIALSHTTVSPTTDPGIQISYSLGFEQISPTHGIVAYSDNTDVLKYKKFNIATNAWDNVATSINIIPAHSMKSVRSIPSPVTNDIVIFAADSNRDLFSIIYDGANDSMFTSPAEKAWLGHGTNGSAITDFWFDFAWDGM